VHCIICNTMLTSLCTAASIAMQWSSGLHCSALYTSQTNDMPTLNAVVNRGYMFVGALAYADDIVLVSPTAHGMQSMLKMCEDYAMDFDVVFNGSKSKCVVNRPRRTYDCDVHVLASDRIQDRYSKRRSG